MKTREHGLTDEQVEAEIERLIRDLEKKGKALADSGITRELLDELYSKCEEDE